MSWLATSPLQLIALALVSILTASCGSGGSPAAPTPPPPPPTPQPPANRPPNIDAMNVSPFGVSGLTPINMSASVSDPEGDAVTLRWTFAGASAATPTVSTTIVGDGPVTVTLTATDSKGASISGERVVNIGNMTGRWNYVPTNGAGCGVYGLGQPPVLHLQQNGTVITGTMTSPNAWCNVPGGTTGVLDPSGPGSIDANGMVKFRLKIGAFNDLMLTSQMEQTGRQLTGSAVNQNSGTFTTHWLRKIS